MFKRIGNAIRRFMYGRYGSDQLNLALLITAITISLTNSILAAALSVSVVYTNIISPLLYLLTTLLLVLCLVRMFSRSIYRRQQENKVFLRFWNRLRDRKNRYFSCPNCRQVVRVPRHRGKINIRCPKCGEKFIRKT